MASLPVVEHLDVLEQRPAGGRARLPRRLVHRFDLQGREEALGDGGVPTIAAPSHAADDPRRRPARPGSCHWRTGSHDPSDGVIRTLDVAGPMPWTTPTALS